MQSFSKDLLFMLMGKYEREPAMFTGRAVWQKEQQKQRLRETAWPGGSVVEHQIKWEKLMAGARFHRALQALVKNGL